MSKRKIEKSQDGSAYWHYVMNRGSYTQDGKFKEEVDADPDQLAEDDVLINKSELSEEDEEALSIYYRIVDAGFLKQLAPRQREVWKLRFFKWLTDEEISKKLSISLSAVRAHLARAAKKIRKAVQKKQRRKAMLDGHYFNDGFKKGVDTAGNSSTDLDMEIRLENGRIEIEAFLKANPELRNGK